MLLDTQFLIELERELDAAAVGPARRFLGSRRSAPVLVSTISIGELAAGMNTNEAARRLVSRFRRVSLSTEAALVAADIDRQLIGLGLRLGENDNWLAGTARYYGVPIVSNDDDFDRVLSAAFSKHKVELNIQLECPSFKVVGRAVGSGQ